MQLLDEILYDRLDSDEERLERYARLRGLTHDAPGFYDRVIGGMLFEQSQEIRLTILPTSKTKADLETLSKEFCQTVIENANLKVFLEGRPPIG